MKLLARVGLVMAFLLTGSVVTAVALYPTAAIAQDEGDEGGGDEGGGDEGGGDEGGDEGGGDEGGEE